MEHHFTKGRGQAHGRVDILHHRHRARLVEAAVEVLQIPKRTREEQSLTLSVSVVTMCPDKRGERVPMLTGKCKGSACSW